MPLVVILSWRWRAPSTPCNKRSADLKEALREVSKMHTKDLDFFKVDYMDKLTTFARLEDERLWTVAKMNYV